MECSPFSRTVTTCAQIAPQIGITEVKFNYDYIEHVNESIFPNGNPLPELDVKKRASLEEFSRDIAAYNLDDAQGHLTLIDDEEGYQQIGIPMYPETKA